MAIPEGFEEVSPNVPEGFEVVSDVAQGLGQQVLGAADALAGITSQGIGTSLGGLAGSFAAGSPLLDVTAQEGEQISEDISQADIFNIFPLTEQGKKTVRAIGENETLKKITEFLDQAGDLAGEFGFNLLDPIGKALGIENLGAIGGTAGKLTPDALIAAATAGTGKVVGAGIKGTVKTAKEAIPGVVEAGKDIIPVVKEAFTPARSPEKQRMIELIQSGAPDIEAAKFELTPSPLKGGQTLQPDATFNNAVKQGFNEGALSAIKQSAPVDKAKALKMVETTERALRDFKFGKTNRASDVLGDSLLDRFKIVTRANNIAGKEIGRISKTLEGQPIDLSSATAGFAASLDELGISLVPKTIRDDAGALIPDPSGELIPDFSVSKVGPGNRAPLKEVVRQMFLEGRGGIDGLSAHNLKKAIDEQITFGKVKSGIGGQMEKALRDFRTNIDDSLDTTFPVYDQANVQYRETITSLEEFQRVAGTIDLFGENADKAIGTLMRRVSGNAASRISLLDASDELTAVARKYENFGAGPKRIGKATTKIDDDLIDQVIVVDELEAKFGPAGTTSFQGQIKQGVEQAGRALLSPKAGLVEGGIKLAADVAESLQGIDNAGAFKAIRELLRGKQ